MSSGSIALGFVEAAFGAVGLHLAMLWDLGSMLASTSLAKIPFHLWQGHPWLSHNSSFAGSFVGILLAQSTYHKMVAEKTETSVFLQIQALGGLQ